MNPNEGYLASRPSLGYEEKGLIIICFNGPLGLMTSKKKNLAKSK
jgi:hypothetical protein